MHTTLPGETDSSNTSIHSNSLGNKPMRRCAIYTRKSTEKGLDVAFSSLDAQRLYCERYIKTQEYDSWYVMPERYDDGAYSGSNTDRPAFQKLLADIKAGLIDVVVVYKSDRLARSLLDALQVIRMFREHNVDFVSVTQKFDTTTAHGRLSMHIMFSFDECYRDASREHTIGKIAISKQRGMWMGGSTPLGYDNVDKKLIVNEKEAATVRFIFGEFIKKKSLMKLARLLREKGIKNKNARVIGYFTTASLRSLLNNPTYIGKVKHKEALYDGQHESIISDQLWQASRRTLSIKPAERSGITKRKIPFVLMGLLKCGCCNSSMKPAYTKKKYGKLYRYYVSQAHIKAKCVDCQIKQISAHEIESLVFNQLHQMFQTPEVLVETWKQANQVNSLKQPNQPKQLNQNSACSYISEEQVRDALVNINSVWNSLFPGEQERVLNLMIEKVIMQPDSVKLQLKDDGFLNFVQNKIEHSKNDHNRDTVSN